MTIFSYFFKPHKQYLKNNLDRLRRIHALVFSDLLYYHKKRKYVTDVTDLFFGGFKYECFVR